MAAVDVFGSLDVVINNAGYGNLFVVKHASSDSGTDQKPILRQTNMLPKLGIFDCARNSDRGVSSTDERLPISRIVNDHIQRAKHIDRRHYRRLLLLLRRSHPLRRA